MSTGDLRERYCRTLQAFAAEGGEALREEAFTLGREALEQGLGTVDLALLQKDAVAGLAPGLALERASEFLAEALAPYEMRLRGAQEANAQLRELNLGLEQKVEERTRGLLEKEAQLQQAHKMEAIGRVAGSIAHDFNNLLSVISSYIELGMESVTDAGARADLRHAGKAADQAADVVRQLLSFSRPQAQSPRRVDLNQALQTDLELLTKVLPSGVKLRFDPSSRACHAWVDPTQLSQVLMNLVINARDAMPQGGEIRVATAPVRHDGPACLLAVSDNGSGMDARTLSRIFEPFFTTKPHGKGTGLGLATVYAIVEQNRGGIEVDSRPGEGSTFKIYLPSNGPSAKLVSA